MIYVMDDNWPNWAKWKVRKWFEQEGLIEAFDKKRQELKPKYHREDGRTDTDKLFRAAQALMPPMTPMEPGEVPEVEKEPEPEPEDEPEPVEWELSDTELDQLAEKSGSIDFEADFEWAYSNIGRRTVDVEDAPSSAAYFLWEYYRTAKQRLVETAAKLHAAKVKNTTDSDKVMEDDKRKQFKLINALQEPQVCPHCGEEI